MIRYSRESIAPNNTDRGDRGCGKRALEAFEIEVAADHGRLRAGKAHRETLAPRRAGKVRAVGRGYRAWSATSGSLVATPELGRPGVQRAGA